MTVTTEASPEPEARDHEPVDGPSDRRVALAGWSCGLAWFVATIVANIGLLSGRVFEDGDFAANSILIDKATTGRLLVGNYSRVGFNHPGPAILDFEAAGQLVFQRGLNVVHSPFQGQFLGILTLNAMCIGIVGSMVFRRSRSIASLVALVALVGLIDVWEPYAFTSTWMPNTYILPFLLLCVGAASVGGSEWRDLRWMIAGAGVTVHGHVSFMMFAGVTCLAAIACGWRGVRRGGRPRPGRRDLAWAGAVATAFALPILVNLVLHWPGEFGHYIDFTSKKADFKPRGVTDVIGFVLRYVVAGRWVIGGLMAVSIATVVWSDRTRRSTDASRFRRACLAIVALESVLVAVYAARGVDDLSQTYVGLFALVCPVLVLWCGVAASLEFVPPSAHRGADLVAATLAALLAIVTVAGDTATNPYRGDPFIRVAASHVSAPAVRIDFTTAGWPLALGLVEELRREGVDVCVVNPVWGFLVTRPLLCRAGAPGDTYMVLGPGESAPGRELVRSGAEAIAPA